MIAEFPKNSSPRSFSATINYAAREMEKYKHLAEDEKPELVHFQNLDNAYFAAEEMEMTASMGKLKDPVTHLIISMDEGEKPTMEQLQEICKHSLEVTGYGNRQAIAWLQKDNGIFHVHIVANKVDPVSYRGLSDGFSRNKANYALAEKAMRELEIRQGWRRLDGKHYSIYKEQVVRTQDVKKLQDRDLEFAKAKSDPAIAVENSTGIDSFQGRCMGEPQRDIEQLFKQNKVTWQEVHKCLNKHNLEIRQHTNAQGNNGYVIVDRDNPEKYHMAASKFCNSVFRKATLEKKIGGPFQERPLVLIGNKEKGYEAYIEGQKRNNEIYKKYHASKQQYQREMDYLKNKCNYKEAMRTIASREHSGLAEVRRQLNPRTKTYTNHHPSKKVITQYKDQGRPAITQKEAAQRIAEIQHKAAQERAAFKADHARQKQAVMEKYDSARGDYKTYLAKEVEKGNSDALEELARVDKSHPVVRNNTIVNGNIDLASIAYDISQDDLTRSLILLSRFIKEYFPYDAYDKNAKNVRCKAERNGDITFRWANTEKRICVFKAGQGCIKVVDHSEEGIKRAIHLARVRNNGQIEIQNGSDEFKRKVVEVAVREGYAIQNSESKPVVSQITAHVQARIHPLNENDKDQLVVRAKPQEQRREGR